MNEYIFIKLKASEKNVQHAGKLNWQTIIIFLLIKEESMDYIRYAENAEKEVKIINMEDEKIECELCHRVLKKINFYQTNNLEKYPDGFVHKCKKCLTMTVDN